MALIKWFEKELDDIISEFDSLYDRLTGHVAKKLAESDVHAVAAQASAVKAAAATTEATRAAAIAANVKALIAK